MRMPRIFTRASAFLGKREAAYPAAGTGILNGNWGSSNAGPNTALNGSLERLRRRSRQEARANGWASAGIETIVTNTIGSGIRPMHSSASVMALFASWSDECDAHGYTDLYGMEALVMRSVVEAGEVFARFRPRRQTDGMSVPLQIEILEAEMIPVSMNETLDNGNKIISGIEFNTIGRIVAYHVCKDHPGESYPLMGMGDVETVRVPAYRMMHIRLISRPGQVRGEPWLARALVTLKDLNEFSEAQLIKQKVSALFGGFIQTPGADDDDEVVAGLTAAPHPDDEGVVVDPLEPGSFPVLPAGYDVKFSSPPDAGAGFDAFLKTNLRSIAASLGVTYFQLTNDFSGMNDRLIRAALLEFKRRARMWQQQLIVHQFLKPIWQQFIAMAVLSGKISQSEEGLDVPAKWIPEAWEYLNPVQDVAAQEAEVKAGFKSRSEVIRSRSKQPEDVDAEIAADNERADDLGLSHTSDARFSNGLALEGEAEQEQNENADEV